MDMHYLQRVLLLPVGHIVDISTINTFSPSTRKKPKLCLVEVDRDTPSPTTSSLYRTIKAPQSQPQSVPS